MAQTQYKPFRGHLLNREGEEATLWLSLLPTSYLLPRPPRDRSRPNVSSPGNLRKATCWGQLHGPSLPSAQNREGGEMWGTELGANSSKTGTRSGLEADYCRSSRWEKLDFSLKHARVSSKEMWLSFQHGQG